MKYLAIILVLFSLAGCGSSTSPSAAGSGLPPTHNEGQIPVFHARASGGKLAIRNGQVTVQFNDLTTNVRSQSISDGTTTPTADTALADLSELANTEEQLLAVIDYSLPQTGRNTDGSLGFGFDSVLKDSFLLLGTVAFYQAESGRILPQTNGNDEVNVSFEEATITLFRRELQPQLTGTVLRSGEIPVADAIVTAQDTRTGVSHITTSRPDGHYFFVDLDSGGPYIVSASQGESLSEQIEVNIVTDEVSTVNISLET